MAASACGHTATVELLLLAGANTDVTDEVRIKHPRVTA